VIINDKVFGQRHLGDVVLVSDLGLPLDRVERSLEAFRMTWSLLRDELGVPQHTVPVMYLTKKPEIIRAAIERNFVEPGWIAGYAYISDDEVEIVIKAEDASTYNTVGHEVTHIAVQLGINWMDEGLAEYFGFRVGEQFDPKNNQTARLQRRFAVRQAAAQDSLYSLQGLLSWVWSEAVTKEEVELFYAQSWWLTDYLFQTFSLEQMRLFYQALLAGQPFSSAFEGFLGENPQMIIADFSVDVQSNLLEEERIADSLCPFGTILEQHNALIAEWNTLLESGTVGKKAKQTWLSFSQRYQQLHEETAALAVEQPVVELRDRYAQVFQWLAEVAQHYAEGNISAGNSLLAQANALSSEAISLFNGLAEQYTWGVCAN